MLGLREPCCGCMLRCVSCEEWFDAGGVDVIGGDESQNKADGFRCDWCDPFIRFIRMLQKKESPLTKRPASNAPPLEIHAADGAVAVQDSPPDLEIQDGNADAVVQDPPPDLEVHDEADASVDSVPRMINEDPGPAPVWRFLQTDYWFSQHDVLLISVSLS